MNRNRHAPRLTSGEVIGSILILAVVVLFMNFCLWQLRRLDERRAYNAAVSARMTAPAVPLDVIIADTAGSLYRRVEAYGRYDNDRSIVLPGRSHEGTPGIHLVTPILLSDSTAILVNRGWVPSADAATITLDSFPAPSPAHAAGLALPFLDERASISSRTADSAATTAFRRVWYSIDDDVLRAQFPYRLAPFVLQLLPDTGAFTYPRPLPPPTLGEGSHLGYAMQWFSFAVIAIVGWVTFLVRRRAERSGVHVVRAPPHPTDV